MPTVEHIYKNSNLSLTRITLTLTGMFGGGGHTTRHTTVDAAVHATIP